MEDVNNSNYYGKISVATDVTGRPMKADVPPPMTKCRDLVEVWEEELDYSPGRAQMPHALLDVNAFDPNEEGAATTTDLLGRQWRSEGGQVH